MNIASLDQRIELQRKNTTLDSTGGEITEWERVATLWTQKLSRPGIEFYQAGRVIAEALVYFIVRFRDDIDESMRVVDATNTEYDITSVTHDDQRKNLTQIACRRVS